MANYQLKAWRKALMLSQQDVADKMGVTRETYSSYEQGRRIPCVYSLFALEEVLGVSARKIYESFDGSVIISSMGRGKEIGFIDQKQECFPKI